MGRYWTSRLLLFIYFYFILFFQAECSALRREAELELEVLNGNVTDWDSSRCPPPRQLGPILKMGRVMLNWGGLAGKEPATKDKAESASAHRFLVAFTKQLVVLSTVPSMTSFVFQVSET